MAVVAAISLVGALVITTMPAAGQGADALEPAAVTGTVDPASIIDVEGFTERAAAWADAQTEHREESLVRAEALAAETKAAEEAEEARLEAEEQARRAAEEEARRQAEEEARRAAEAAAAATSTTSTTTPATVGSESAAGDDGAAPSPGGPTPEQWHALRECESSNNYQAVSPSGRYRGAYQFSTSTWDWLASTQYPGLIGVDPSTASPADQDNMAAALYVVYGASPWPVCGQFLS